MPPKTRSRRKEGAAVAATSPPPSQHTSPPTSPRKRGQTPPGAVDATLPPPPPPPPPPPAPPPPPPPPPLPARRSRTVVAASACCCLLLAAVFARTQPALPPWLSPAPPPPPRCFAGADAAALAQLLPPDWAGWAEALAHSLASPSASEHHKAPVMLLLTPPAAVSVASQRALEQSLLAVFPGCAVHASPPRCFAALDLAAFASAPPGEARGRLQSALSSALLRAAPLCPGPLLVLHSLHLLPPSAASALLPLLSEGGAYQLDGLSLAAHGAAVVLVAQLPAPSLDDWAAVAAGGEQRFEREAKAALQRLFESSGVEELGRALRRRVDFVAPLRSLLDGSLN